MVVLGTSTMPIHQVMRLSRGAIIELDATEADEVKILANNMPVASGVVLVDRNRIAVEVKRMLPRSPDSRSAGKCSPSKMPSIDCRARRLASRRPAHRARASRRAGVAQLRRQHVHR